MHDVAGALERVRRRIREAEVRFGRPEGNVRLVAVSKTKPAEAVLAVHAAGQRDFGENQLQDALPKLDALADRDVCWHFIGPVQSNKTRRIATRFDWVHSLDRVKIAHRLSEQRPPERPPLDVLVEVNVSGEASKSGVPPARIGELVQAVETLPRLRLRGLMTLPAPATDPAAQRAPFARLREALEALNAKGRDLDTLSMGMTGDMEAAIAEGATMVRVGTAIFGPRPWRSD